MASVRRAMTECSQRDTVFWYAALPCGILDGVGRAGKEHRPHGRTHADGRSSTTGLYCRGPPGLGRCGCQRSLSRGALGIAVDAMRGLPLCPLVHALLRAA
jgi:hypothetical protein